MKAIRKFIWKRRLRRRYLAYRALLDSYTCGAALAEYISRSVREAKEKVNEAIRRCNELDPQCGLKEIE